MLYPSAIEGVDFDEEEVSSDEEIQPIKAKKSAPVLRNECKTFDALNLSRSILKAVLEAGFFEPTPIQSACIPIALSGRDICACASTGTGKTAAFMLPILERLLYKPRGQKSTTRVLVLVPTRELAIQVFEVSRRLGKYTNVEICLAVGGLDIKAQEAALRLGLDIVIATPGRLVDHLHNSPNFSLANIEVLVLDEADRMLDEQFMDQMKEIIKLCSYNRQTMLFSATLTEKVEDLVNLSLKKPVKLFINEETDLALNLHQEFVRIRNDEKVRRREAIVAALVMNTFSNHSIIFIRTKHACERMNVLLRLLGVKVGRLHGGLTQTQRVDTLQAFRRQQDVQVLCATDLAARGLDIEGVLTVINMHMPSTLKQYIHRVGRTARAGKAGRSISLIGEEDRKLMKEILKMNTKGKGPAAGNRKIEPNVVDSLMKQIEELRPKVDKILEDEKYEKQFKQAEKSIKEVEQKLKSLDAVKKPIVKPERKWFKSDKRNQKIAGQNGKRMSKGRKREEKKERKFGHSSDPAKRGKHEERAKPTGGKSSFTAEIAYITQRAIKRHRHGPDDQEFKKLKREKDGARGGKERTKRK